MVVKKRKNKIGVIGDLHAKDFLSYSEYIPDQRIKERNDILDFIVKTFEDCDHIVLLGDIFNQKNNSSETIKEVVKFLERFNQKEVYLLSGNHEKKGDGKTAIDFLKEVNKPNWHIFTTGESLSITGLKVTFLPYLFASELGLNTSEEVSAKLIKDLEGGDILFAHHAISGTTFQGLPTELLKEPVLNKEKLEKKYKLVMAGHIHDPQEVGRTVIAGSVFTAQVGEIEKFIWKINEDLSVEKFKVPNREIHKIENPTDADLDKIKSDSIVKVVLTKKKKEDIETFKKKLAKKFDAYLLIENYPSKRKKMHIEGGALDFSLESLLKMYAEAREVDYQKLLKGLELIK